MLENLNIFDYIIFSIIALSSLFAFLKGFVRTFLSFIGWIFTSIAAYFLFPYLKPPLTQYIKTPLFIDLAAGIISYILSLIVVSLINYQLNKLTKNLQGGLLDRSMGFTFGIIRGCLIACIIFWSISISSIMFLDKDNREDHKKFPSWVVNSKSYNVAKLSTKIVDNLLPENLYYGLSVANFKRLDENNLSNLDAIDKTSKFLNKAKILNILNSLPIDSKQNIDKNTIERFKNNELTLEQEKSLVTIILNSYYTTLNKLD